jgi:vitamin B12/bleomycin/antimicrobial peptide transport system ATP-binding/permease protein
VRPAELARPDADLARVDAWPEIFSVGEQQRIAFLRLLRQRPVLAILDEATSAMDIATEQAMYEQLAAACASYVSVGHRPQLAKYHTHVLMWQAPGEWRLMEAAEYAQAG